jgi:hypothetical protein
MCPLPEHIVEKLFVCRFATIVEFRLQRVAELSKQAARVVLLKDREARRPLIYEICQYLKIDLNEPTVLLRPETACRSTSRQAPTAGVTCRPRVASRKHPNGHNNRCLRYLLVAEPSNVACRA